MVEGKEIHYPLLFQANSATTRTRGAATAARRSLYAHFSALHADFHMQTQNCRLVSWESSTKRKHENAPNANSNAVLC